MRWVMRGLGGWVNHLLLPTPLHLIANDNCDILQSQQGPGVNMIWSGTRRESCKMGLHSTPLLTLIAEEHSRVFQSTNHSQLKGLALHVNEESIRPL